MKLFFRIINSNLLLILASFILISSVNAQDKSELLLNRDSVIAAAREIIGMQHYCALITIDSAGLPNIRTMNPYPLEDDLIVWMATNRAEP